MPLGAVLAAQAALLFSNLALLPVWMDELFTLRTAALGVERMLPVLQADIHPPLYYLLLHVWPWGTTEGMRAFSGVWALAATVLLDVLWTRGWRPARRWTALCLFAFSPALLMFGRMARSYSMQCALTVVAVYFLWRWMREGRGAGAAFGGSVALLYTHYVPGLAVLAGFAAVGWRRLGWTKLALFGAGVAAAYAPWLMTLAGALERWGEAGSFSARYLMTGSPVREQILKAGFGVTSLTVGESFAGWALALIAPAAMLVGLGWRRAERGLKWMLAVSAVVGYVGATRWVSYAFVGPRLLWLLPFVCLGVGASLGRKRWRWGVAALMLVSAAWSGWNYFGRSGYLNKGYAAPIREIAAEIAARPGTEPLVLIDAYNTDIDGQRYYLPSGVPAMVLRAEDEAAARVAVERAGTVWVVRNQRDISPGGVTTAVEQAACDGRERRVRLYLPYEGWQRLALMAMFAEPPTHFYKLTECEKRTAGH